ncbi:MAG: hypothetical protein ACE5HA_12335, partial [Anaerolineae bacterium]
SGASASGFAHLHLEFRDGCLYQDCNRNPWEYLPYTDQPPALPALQGANLATPFGTLLLLEASTPADQLDLDGLDLTLGPDSVQLSFNNINTTTPREWPEALDYPVLVLNDDVEACLFPAKYNTSSVEASYRLAFRGLDAGTGAGSASVRDLNGPGPAISLSPALAPLTLSPAAQHVQTSPGAAAEFVHTVQNDGFETLTLSLTAQSAQNNIIALDPTSLNLDPGDSQVINLTVDFSTDLAPGIGDCVVLEVDAGAGTSTIAIDRITTGCYDLYPPSGVGAEDILAVAGYWHLPSKQQTYVAAHDVNGDGVTNIVDIGLVTTAWGNTCP